MKAVSRQTAWAAVRNVLTSFFSGSAAGRNSAPTQLLTHPADAPALILIEIPNRQIFKFEFEVFSKNVTKNRTSHFCEVQLFLT